MCHKLHRWCFVLVVALLGVAAQVGVAQPASRWVVSGGVGAVCYQGDVSELGFGTFRGKTWLMGGSLRYRWNEYLQIGMAAHKGRIRAEDLFFDDPYRQARAFSFATDFTDLALDARFYPLGQHRFMPFTALGVGVIQFQDNAYLLDNTHLPLADLVKIDLEAAYDKRAWMIPVSFGLEWKMMRWLSLESGLQYVFTTTDYLDGVSVSGNPGDKDRYGQVFLKAAFHLGNTADLDKDGIPDWEDACPLKPGTARTQGCPDYDGDGVEDAVDHCPMAPGEAAMQGCPDTDGDGIADPYDRCPVLAGTAETLGCPPQDTDGDGVQDHQDDCPTTKGPPERRGCPAVDTDEDGILDEDDACPEWFGLPLFNGCPDSDGDGIEDIRDACPQTLGYYEKGGCPKWKNDREAVTVLSAQVLFFKAESADINTLPFWTSGSTLASEPLHNTPNKGFADGAGGKTSPAYISQLRARKGEALPDGWWGACFPVSGKRV
ncbi:MAG: thrombospondin type 3 repeat-containing protein [Saprospiraceae bacterium]